MPNPASKFCQAQGGESKIITNADDSQSGVCVLPYGIECDEWKYFRGECPASVTCTAEQKAAEICTMEYMPTCGDDGVTYGNKCTACGSKNIDSYVPGECPAKTYVTRDLEQCKVIRYVCIKGKAAFSDEFGCGCEPETTCGNGVCDAGEADQCPACYYSTPPCLAPCTAGTCSEDCAPTDGKLKATDCQNPRTQACTKEYMPVCGWFNTSIQCIKYPCAANYGNKCTACADYKVAYWTDERCPNTSDGSEGNTEPGSPGSGNTESTGIANPASVYCVEHGGTLDIRDDVENEGQIGLCILPGGAECEEWAYFRGECQ
jgi:putative hemolysin